MKQARRWLDSNRLTEFPALKDSVYLDHAGTTLASRSQLDGFHRDMLSNLYGNPHSHSPSSLLTSDTVDQIRYRILQYFNTTQEKYSVLFTSGCTASLKLVTELFDFQGNQCCHGDKTPVIGSRQITANTYNRVREKPDLDCIPEFSPETYNQEQFRGDHKFPGNEDSNEIDSGKSCPGCRKGVGGSFTYLVDNHTSVQGMREVALLKAGRVSCIGCHDTGQSLDSEVKVLFEHEHFQNGGNNLFTYPAQSNYSGWKYPQKWVQETQQCEMQWQRSWQGSGEAQCQGHHHGNSWYVLLDAAALVSTSPLDLDTLSPDFVTLSFYKMFGFPTGLGALLVKNDSGHLLKKTYYGGGTVEVSLPSQLFHRSRSSLSDRLEDGTISFLDIIALRHGFDALENLAGGIRAVSEYTFGLAQYFYKSLTSCCHGNGCNLAEVYTYSDFSNSEEQGAIVNFNLKRANGEYIGFATATTAPKELNQSCRIWETFLRLKSENVFSATDNVDSMAQLHNIHVRTGCFCNIGACQHFLKITDEQIKQNFEAGHVCGDNNDLIDGMPTGSVRVSFGYMSTLQDAQRCLQVIVDCFLEHSQKPVFLDGKAVSQSSDDTKPVFCDRKTVSQSRDDTKPVYCDRKTVRQSSDDTKPVFCDRKTVSQSSDDPKPVFCDRKTVGQSSVAQEEVIRQIDGSGDTRPSVTTEAVEAAKVETMEEFANCSGKHLSEICLYPVKSCAAFKVNSWPLGARGLLYDREWMIVTETGIAMSQKREPKLCLLRPSINRQTGRLRLDFPGMEPVEVPLHLEVSSNREVKLCNSRVCGDRVDSTDCGDAVGAWLSEALKRPGCRLIQQKSDDKRSSNMKMSKDGDVQTKEGGHLSLANVSQFLLISRESVASLHKRINHEGNQSSGKLQSHEEENQNVKTQEIFDVDNLVDRFRANLVVSGCEAFEEDSWNNVQIGNIRFTCQGPCTRCQMICMDQRTGQKSTEPLKTLQLWKERKTTFGIHMCTDTEWSRPDMEVRVGDPVFLDNQHTKDTES